MSELNNIALQYQSIDHSDGFKRVANLSTSLLTRIKNILASLGLYTFDANDAARSLIPVLSDKNLVQREYKNLSDDEKEMIYTVVDMVERAATGSVRNDFSKANDSFKNLYDDDVCEKVISRDRALVNSEKEKLSAEKPLTKEAIKRQQESNSRVLLTQLQNAAASVGNFDLHGALLQTFSSYMHPRTQMEHMIDLVDQNGAIDMFNDVISGKISKEELLSGTKLFATYAQVK